jgi:26S proteasome regulatory subunit N5
MVSGHGVYAKLDRPAGIVTFVRPRTAAETLNEWAHGVGKLLELVEDTCHHISKETMVHKPAAAAAAK